MATASTPPARHPLSEVLPKVELVETDGDKLESPWHHAEITLLLDVLTYWFRDRTDFYAGGNMFIYYSEEQARDKDYRGPDFFYVNGVNRHPARPYWAVWQEGGKYPNLIIELLSPTTAEEDRTTKKELYERTFRTPEYFLYDPDTQQLEGWRLGKKCRYQRIKPGAEGRLWSEVLDCWLGTARGSYLGLEDVWLRFFDKEGNLRPAVGEAEAQGRMAAEAEVARLKALLAEREGQGKEDPAGG